MNPYDQRRGSICERQASVRREVSNRWARRSVRAVLIVAALVLAPVASGPRVVRADEQGAAPQFEQVSAILNKYCAGCHNAEDKEGELVLDSYAGLIQGGRRGSVITSRRSDSSRLVRVLTGEAEPAMPPEDNEKPGAAEIAVLKAWIDAGARGPSGEFDPTVLKTPRIEPMSSPRLAISAVAVSPAGDKLAVARYGVVELSQLNAEAAPVELPGHRGNVNAISFSQDGSILVAAAGEPGVFGEARLWDVASGRQIEVVQGHRDSLYAAVLSPDGQLLATAGYDHSIKLWDVASGRELRTLEGHNGAVFELAFRPDGRVLASASADRTVKLWDVNTGERLDTLKESLKELYALAFSPDGTRVAAGGVDNRIRVWRVSESAREGTNPLLFSVFAHEGPILRLIFSRDGHVLVSSAEDQSVKAWHAESVTPHTQFERQGDWPTALAMTNDHATLVVGRLDGEIARYPLSATVTERAAVATPLSESFPEIDYGDQPAADKLPRISEIEPNGVGETATALALPAIATGRIHSETSQASHDADRFRFQARAGDQWIFEINAAQSKSPLDSKIAILHPDGSPVPRVLLRAVRDSMNTFRPIDSNTTDARLLHWEEMDLNEYVYLNGEVVKLFRRPQGPDSGYQFYPGQGSRTGYFDTSARGHALDEPCYVVVPYPVGTVLPDNGLPRFTVNYENDDDARRKLGSDSRLTFVAPADGDYLVQVTDIRGFQGEDFNYELTVRRPAPDFKVTLSGDNPTVNAGSGKEFTVRAERIDGFEGPIQIDIQGLPPGFTVTTPMVIEAGQIATTGVIASLPHSPAPTEANMNQTKIVATADVAGKRVSRDVNSLGTIRLAGKPKLVASLVPTGSPESGKPEVASPPDREWTVLEPKIFSTRSAASLGKLSDNSLLATGENPDTDTYTIVVQTQARDIRALRLETLPHPSLPTGGSGRADETGSFVLTQIKVVAIPLQQPDQPLAVNLADATTDDSPGGFDARAAIDGDPKTGWATRRHRQTQPAGSAGPDAQHWAAFEFAHPVGFEGGTMLAITLVHEGELKKHNLGRFRLSYTTQERPPVDLRFPAFPEVVLAPGTMSTCELRVERDGIDDRIQLDVNNLPHGVIVEDIGLNGVLIPEGQLRRTIYLRAESWVPEADRWMHAIARVDGNQVSLPVLLRIRRPAQVAGTDRQ